jgi:hypothetical protein
MEEILEFCQRVLGVGDAATEAARDAHASGAAGRVELLAAASRACRARSEPSTVATLAIGNGAQSLTSAVAKELALATSQLPERQREALALRERAQLSYEEMGRVMGVGAAAVAPLLARARLRLREERRGAPPLTTATCEQRDRALRALAQRQDGQPLDRDEDGWLADHLCDCESCRQAHAAMLEASVCYRAWSLESTPRPTQVASNGGDEVRDAAPDAPGQAPQAPGETPGQAPDDAPGEAPGDAPAAQAPRWWRRALAALAADARR